MAFHPFPALLKEAWQAPTAGNFGLWHNKYVPLDNLDGCHASDDNGVKERAVEYYAQHYKRMIQGEQLPAMLDLKNDALDAFLASCPEDHYEKIVIAARLTSPLVTGIGESHPHEVGMVFDNNLGVPYIPASGIKGIARFAHTLSIWEDGLPADSQENLIDRDANGQIRGFNDEEYEPVYSLFGNQKNRGRVIFLDAYPARVPGLHVDIMNPHYGDYYGDEKKTISPADYLSPNPIKFLTVAPGTVFFFRAVAERGADLPAKVRAALIRALTEEGVGAKTAVGYGRFIVDEEANADRARRFERRIREEEEKRHPWRGPLERLKDVQDWDAFKTRCLENETLVSHRENREVAAAVKAKAVELRELWKKKWSSARDEQIAAWLAPAGESWEPMASVPDAPREEPFSESCKMVDKLKNWEDYKTAGLDPSGLDQEALRLLLKKMKQWGCADRKAKADKGQAYRRVKECLRSEK